MSLIERVQARQMARDMFIILDEDEPEDREAYWEAVIEMATVRHKGVELQAGPPEKMTDEEARLFERQQMPGRFKAHAGTPVGDVPADYLLYITKADPFVDELKRYTASDRFQRFQDEPED